MLISVNFESKKAIEEEHGFTMQFSEVKQFLEKALTGKLNKSSVSLVWLGSSRSSISCYYIDDLPNWMSYVNDTDQLLKAHDVVFSITDDNAGTFLSLLKTSIVFEDELLVSNGLRYVVVEKQNGKLRFAHFYAQRNPVFYEVLKHINYKSRVITIITPNEKALNFLYSSGLVIPKEMLEFWELQRITSKRAERFTKFLSSLSADEIKLYAEVIRVYDKQQRYLTTLTRLMRVTFNEALLLLRMHLINDKIEGS